MLPLRELTGWEEEYLAQHQHDANTATVCNEVLAMCSVAPGELPGEEIRSRVGALLVAERDRALVQLRRLSLGPRVDAQVFCPSCGEAGEASFSLDDLELDFPVPARRLPVALGDNDENGGVKKVRLPTAADQAALLDANLENPAERRTWLLGRCILDATGNPIGAAAARDLPLRQRAAIERAVESTAPALDLEMVSTCVHCDGTFTAPFDIATFFFRSSQACSRPAPRRTPSGTRLPLVGGGDLELAATPSARLPHAARGGRRRGTGDEPGRRRHRQGRAGFVTRTPARIS